MEQNERMEQAETTESMDRMEKMEQALAKQNQLSLIQCIISGGLLLCLLGIFYVAITILPDLQLVLQHAESTLTELEQITVQLAEADLQGMVANVDQLVTTSQSGVEETLTKLNSLDFDTLNKAIKDLAAVIQPLAKLSNIFA